MDRDRSHSPHRSGDESRTQPNWRLSGGSMPMASTSSGLKNIHLSPAFSAFQFQQFKTVGTTSKFGSPVMSRSLSNDSRGMPLIPGSEVMQRSASGLPSGASVPPGYFKTLPMTSNLMNMDPPLDEKKKEELRKVEAIPLQNEWTFWLDKFVPNLTPEEYEANLKQISTVGTVQAFWSVFNNITGPDKLTTRWSLHFMKKGIKPIWEDPKNENGGAYNFKILHKDAGFAWRELLMMLIGEQFEEILSRGDTVCGVSISIRYQHDNFQIWTSRAESENVEKVSGRLSEILKPVEVVNPYYKAHKNHAAFIDKIDEKDKQVSEISKGGADSGDLMNGVIKMDLADANVAEK